MKGPRNQAFVLSSLPFTGTQNSSCVHSLFFCPTGQPTFTRRRAMGNKTFYWDGLRGMNNHAGSTLTPPTETTFSQINAGQSWLRATVVSLPEIIWNANKALAGKFDQLSLVLVGAGQGSVEITIQLGYFENLIFTAIRDFRTVFIKLICSLSYDVQAHRMKKKLKTINIKMNQESINRKIWQTVCTQGRENGTACSMWLKMHFSFTL